MSKCMYVLLSVLLSASSYCGVMNGDINKIRKNEENSDGNTALHLAIDKKNFPLAEMILEENEDIDFSKKNNDGETVLHLAALTCSDDNLAFVKLLLESGARSSMKLGNADGETALHVALNFVHPKIAELLIDEGADVNAVNDEKNSPLHYVLEIIAEKYEKEYLQTISLVSSNEKLRKLYAIGEQYLKLKNVARKLIKMGADIEAKRKNGDTPLQLMKLHPDLSIEIPTYDNDFFFEKENSALFDPEDDFKRRILRDPNDKNIEKLIKLTKKTGSETTLENEFKNSRLRVLEILADDGVEKAIDYLYEIGYWEGKEKKKSALARQENMCIDFAQYEANKENIKNRNLQLDQKLYTFICENVKGSLVDKNCKERFRDGGFLNDKFSFIYDIYNSSAVEECGLLVEPPPMNIYAPFPIANEFLSHVSSCGYFHKITADDVDSGWKLHISAKPSAVLNVTEKVIPICEEEDVAYKFLFASTMSNYCIRERFSPNRPFSQMGKSIVIYPKNDEQANRIAERIDAAFRKSDLAREDFYSVFGDFAVGKTGGIYTRFCSYGDGETGRGYPYIIPAMLQLYAVSHSSTFHEYKHPFEKLKLYHNGEELPNNVLKITEKIRHNYNFELVMNMPQSDLLTEH